MLFWFDFGFEAKKIEAESENWYRDAFSPLVLNWRFFLKESQSKQFVMNAFMARSPLHKQFGPQLIKAGSLKAWNAIS